MTFGDRPPHTVRIRPLAVADIESHAAYLDERASPDIVRRFRAALMIAVDQIAQTPSAGAPRDSLVPLLSGLRMWIVPDFRNYLIFYRMSGGAIEIIRIFHGARDIADILANEEEQ